ncbi:putative signal peptide exported protein [Paraburkholderia phymatum STM815]|uniref:Putative signal peptide exported protein n=2 Tax=Paraburkholderia phymatum TaxID=148447 RepID=B2JH55_PARP8|nr:putative signal peptide exported protein [Paraburkholderia phymatum STM815]
MHPPNRIVLSLVLALGTTAIGVRGQSLPEAVSTNGVLYMTGGIGQDEAKAFLSLAPRYSLRMMFTSANGGYLADVDVRIAQADGKQVLDTRTEGPFLYIMLPAGRYRIVANAGRSDVGKWVDVPRRGGVDLHFSVEERAHGGTGANCRECGASPYPGRPHESA